MNNGPFGALAEGFQNGNAMREQKKQRELQEAMQQARLEDMIKQRALAEEMAKAQRAHFLAQENNAVNSQLLQREQLAAEQRRWEASQAEGARRFDGEQAAKAAATSAMRMNGIYASIGDMAQNAQNARLNAARIRKLEEEAKAIANGKGTTTGYQQTTEEDPLTGNKTVMKIPISAGINGMGGGVVPPGGSPLGGRQLPPGVQQQFGQQMVNNQQQIQPGTVATQGGKRYRFDGRTWTEIQ